MLSGPESAAQIRVAVGPFLRGGSNREPVAVATIVVDTQDKGAGLGPDPGLQARVFCLCGKCTDRVVDAEIE